MVVNIGKEDFVGIVLVMNYKSIPRRNPILSGSPVVWLSPNG